MSAIKNAKAEMTETKGLRIIKDVLLDIMYILG